MLWTDPIPFRQPPTAYSKVATAIYEGLKDKHKFAHTPMLATNQLGIFNWGEMMVYRSGQEDFGEDVIEMNSHHFNTDFVLVLKDPFFARMAFNMPLDLMWYVAVDHANVSDGFAHRLRTAFKIVTTSRFGEERLRMKGLKVDEVIPNGYNPQNYFPVDGVGRDVCRQFFRLPREGFVVGFIGRNQKRKLTGQVLKTFKRFVELCGEREKVFMLLWTDMNKEIPLHPVMADLGIVDKVYWPEEYLYRTGIPEKNMHMFYNACDVIICVSGEGFWLPGVEAQACGTPIVVVDYASAPELVGAGFKARVEEYTYDNDVGARQPLVDLDDFAEKLMRVKAAGRESFRERAVEFAKSYTWEKVVEKWRRFLEDCEVEMRPMVTKEGLKPWDVDVS